MLAKFYRAKRTTSNLLGEDIVICDLLYFFEVFLLLEAQKVRMLRFPLFLGETTLLDEGHLCLFVQKRLVWILHAHRCLDATAFVLKWGTKRSRLVIFVEIAAVAHCLSQVIAVSILTNLIQ